ncbi:MAG: putative toxin-antitoxin system toxin component, PIN family [Sulfurovum sp.]|nr:MAG: putative toxin-antitoxin system toxin component, PIN family [Sulfurovum sp.]
MKIVIDTNVIFAALYSSKGASHKFLIWLFESQKKYSVLSNTLVLEYVDVLTRSKNMKLYSHLNKSDIEHFIDDICAISYHQKIHFLWRPFLKDANDDMVLEIAVNSGAKAIITFNLKDFKGVKEKFDIDIITPKIFLQNKGIIQ